MVYLYLTAHGRESEELSLLLVNSLQKDAKHANPLVRASALKALASIRFAVFWWLHVV